MTVIMTRLDQLEDRARSAQPPGSGMYSSASGGGGGGGGGDQ